MSQDHDAAKRRMLLAASGLAAAAALTRPAAAAPRHLALADLKKEGDVACLYHCDFGDPARFGQMLTNISNHYSAYNGDSFAIELVIVAHGAGIKFFLSSLDGTSWQNDRDALAQFDRVADLAKTGLKVHLCEITFARQKIDMARARDLPFISFVPSGVAAIGVLQSRGYGYMKIG